MRSQETDGVDNMLFLCVQIQSRVHQRDCPADTVIPILASNLVQRPVDVGPALGFLHFWEPGQLPNATRRGLPVPKNRNADIFCKSPQKLRLKKYRHSFFAQKHFRLSKKSHVFCLTFSQVFEIAVCPLLSP